MSEASAQPPSSQPEPTEAAPLARLSLLGAIKDLAKSGSRLDASIITTYAFNGVFYEDVLLRSFVSAGSRLNIVLADARQLSEALADPMRRPRRAGKDYILCPVIHEHAFHPKLLILLSETAPALGVGSHNTTDAGFAHNEEMTTFWDGKPAPPRALLQASVDYARHWLERAEVLPTKALNEVTHRLNELTQHCPEGAARDVALALDTQQSLLQSLASRVSAPVRRITVVGPYFDPAFALLGRLEATFKPDEMVVAIAPETALLGDPTKIPSTARFVDIAPLVSVEKRRTGFLHAKAIALESETGLVVSVGSANPSMAAWALGAAGNAEANLIFTGDRARETFAQLGLATLRSAPSISQAILVSAANRSAEERARDQENEKARERIPILHGRLEDAGVVSVAGLSEASDLSLCGADGVALATNVSFEQHGQHLRIRGEGLASGLYLLRREGVIAAYVLVHDENALRANVMSRGGARLLSSLGRIDEYGDFNEVFDLITRHVIDAEPNQRALNASAQRSATTPAADLPEDNVPFGPRGVSLADEQLQRTRKRLLENGLVSDLIATLIASLRLTSRGASSSMDGDAPERDAEDAEEGETSADEIASNAEGELIEADVDWPRLKHACRKRVGVLINRLQRKFGEIEPDPTWELGRLLAVLCLVQKLRMLAPPKGLHFEGAPESLVSLEQLETLYRFAVSHVYGRGTLAARVAESGGAGTYERHLIDNQLMWFARETGADCEREAQFAEDNDARDERLEQRADLIIVAFSAAADDNDEPWLAERSEQLGRWSDARRSAPDWYQRHRTLGSTLQRQLAKGADVSPAPLKSGGYAVWVAAREAGIPRVIRRLNGDKALLVEPGRGGEDKKIMAANLKGMDLSVANTAD